MSDPNLVSDPQIVANLLPEEIGNTNQSLPPSNVTNSYLTWIITCTWDNVFYQALPDWVQRNTQRATWQKEKGETGYVHLQMTLTLKKKQRLSWLKKHFFQDIHAEKARNIDASFDYTTKEHTRIEGPWAYPVPLRGVVPRCPLRGLALYKWQLDLFRDLGIGENLGYGLKDTDIDPDDRKIIWIWDPEGCTGKSKTTRYICLNYNACMFQGGKKDIAYAYKGQKICIFMFSRTTEGKVSYDAIESLTDGMVFSAKYESNMKLYEYPHVICFANWPPDESALSKDRWDIRLADTSTAEIEGSEHSPLPLVA